jgi:hypothetical protein
MAEDGPFVQKARVRWHRFGFIGARPQIQSARLDNRRDGKVSAPPDGGQRRGSKVAQIPGFVRRHPKVDQHSGLGGIHDIPSIRPVED